jgi:hypothetical protein
MAMDMAVDMAVAVDCRLHSQLREEQPVLLLPEHLLVAYKEHVSSPAILLPFFFQLHINPPTFRNSYPATIQTLIPHSKSLITQDV